MGCQVFGVMHLLRSIPTTDPASARARRMFHHLLVLNLRANKNARDGLRRHAIITGDFILQLTKS
jgi:hypothetical protein